MNIEQALSTVATGDTADSEWIDRKIRELPRSDVIVPRQLLLSAITELRRYRRCIQEIKKMILCAEPDPGEGP